MGEHGRDDGMIRTFIGFQCIRMSRIKGESGSTILEGEATAFGCEASTKAHVVTVYITFDQWYWIQIKMNKN